MRAILVPEKGKWAELKEVDLGKPREDEVLIKVVYSSLCYRDYLQLKGFYPRMKYPVILGHEVSGIVEEDPRGEYRKGDRVTSLLYFYDSKCDMCSIGYENQCRNKLGYSEELNGFFSQYAIIKRKSLLRVPSEIDMKIASITPCVIAMVYRGLKKASFTKGMSVLVTGASGAVGVHAVQLVKRMGGEVIAVTSSEEKAKLIEKLGALTITSRKFSDELRRRREVDLVIENVGSATLDESMKSLRPGGKLILIGNLDPSSPFNLRLGYVIVKEIEIIGNVSSTRREVEEVMGYLKDIQPIGKTIEIEDVPNALREIEMGTKGVGKVFVRG
jgi:D-arabinose 1-dehydrogenase-like Zn-dependent alcohol dehydrogenase